jgi:hypothetical protein
LSGLTGEIQRRTVTELHNAGVHGLTWRELSGLTGWHHGSTSGSLSNLHHADRIMRLAETRDRCKVYVLPEFADDRALDPVGQSDAAALLQATMQFLESLDYRAMTIEQRTTRNRLLNRYARRK